MFDFLARLADRHAPRIGLVAIVFFLVAAALGGSGAKRLDPYGADDPATESVRADTLAEDAGYRHTALVVLFNRAPVAKATTRERVTGVERELRRRRDVASVSGYYDTGSRDFVARDGGATYLAVSGRAADDRGQQDSAEAVAASLDDVPGIQVGGPAVASEQVNKQVEHDLRLAELLAFPLLF